MDKRSMFIFPSMYEFIVVIDVFLSVLQDATGRSLVSCILKAYAAVWFFHLRYNCHGQLATRDMTLAI